MRGQAEHGQTDKKMQLQLDVKCYNSLNTEQIRAKRRLACRADQGQSPELVHVYYISVCVCCFGIICDCGPFHFPTWSLNHS